QPGEYTRLSPVLQRATQSRPEQRYGSMDQLLQDMGNVLSSPFQSTSTSNRQDTPGLMNRSSSQSQRKTTPPELLAHPITPVTGLTSNPSETSGPSTGLVALGNAALPNTAVIDPNTPPNPQGTPLSASDWEKQGDKFFTQHAYEDALKAYHRAIEIVNN